MKHKKTIVITLIICIIVAGAFILYHKKKIEREIEANFYKVAIESFWENEDLFEQVKEYFLALPKDVVLATIYCDKKDNIIVMDGSSYYQELKISEGFKEALSKLFMKLKPMKRHIQYVERDYMYNGEYV
jgi:hypothetical protein